VGGIGCEIRFELLQLERFLKLMMGEGRASLLFFFHFLLGYLIICRVFLNSSSMIQDFYLQHPPAAELSAGVLRLATPVGFAPGVGLA